MLHPGSWSRQTSHWTEASFKALSVVWFVFNLLAVDYRRDPSDSVEEGGLWEEEDWHKVEEADMAAALGDDAKEIPEASRFFAVDR